MWCPLCVVKNEVRIICIHLQHFHNTLVAVNTKFPHIAGEYVYKLKDTKREYSVGGTYGVWDGSSYYNGIFRGFPFCFYHCEALTTLPNNLFENKSGIDTFYRTFKYCTSLQSLPSGLFDGQTSAKSFSGCFQNCTQLTAVPDTLLKNNANVTSCDSMFSNCTSLQTIGSIFSYASNLSSIRYCFENCTSLTSD